MGDSALVKSKRFAVRIVNLYKYLNEEKREYHVKAASAVWYQHWCKFDRSGMCNQ